MDFSLTDEQVMIREAAQTFLAGSSSSEAVRAALDMPLGFDPALWNSIAAELGWCALPIAEVHEGMGLGAVEVMLVQEQAGYRLLCAPFFSTVCLATTLLNECADEATQTQLLQQLAAGQLLLTAALPSDMNHWQKTDLVATPDAGHWRLSGSVARVPDAGAAKAILLTARIGEELALFQVDAAAQGLAIAPLETWDASRRFSQLQLSDVVATRCDAAHLAAGLQRSAALVRLYLAAEQLGCAQRCLDLTVAYTLERKQFGRAVGSFQVVKHRCAEMMIHCEATRSAVYGAAALAASEPDLEALQLETAAAKALATEALQFCAGEAIQLHGGVGFTWEYDPQLFFKRGQASAHWLGTPQALRESIAKRLLGEGL